MITGKSPVPQDDPLQQQQQRTEEKKKKDEKEKEEKEAEGEKEKEKKFERVHGQANQQDVLAEPKN